MERSYGRIISVLAACGALAGLLSAPGGPAQEKPRLPKHVTPVRGPSWLNRLGALQSPMGRTGGSEPAFPYSERREPGLAAGARLGPVELSRILNTEFRMPGSGLYRINCRSCHGVNGAGSPPEISSVVPAVSALLHRPEPEAVDMFMRLLADPVPRMPPFDYLSREQGRALLLYMTELPSPPPIFTPPGPVVRETAARAGEQTVKGTCHICHDATGPAVEFPMTQGIVPSLSSFSGYRLSEVQDAVEFGTRPMMMMRRGQSMPSLPFITREEVAAAYYYLLGYPPEK